MLGGEWGKPDGTGLETRPTTFEGVEDGKDVGGGPGVPGRRAGVPILRRFLMGSKMSKVVKVLVGTGSLFVSVGNWD